MESLNAARVIAPCCQRNLQVSDNLFPSAAFKSYNFLPTQCSQKFVRAYCCETRYASHPHHSKRIFFATGMRHNNFNPLMSVRCPSDILHSMT